MFTKQELSIIHAVLSERSYKPSEFQFINALLVKIENAVKLEAETKQKDEAETKPKDEKVAKK